MDILDFFRRRYSWRKLCVLVGQLPKGSAYWTARLQDEELAEAILAEEAQSDVPRDKPSGPDIRDYTPDNQLLTQVVDKLSVVVHLLELLGGGKPGRIKPLPKPVTAMDRVMQRLDELRLTSIEDEVYQAMERAVS